jgi:hypothetical protein
MECYKTRKRKKSQNFKSISSLPFAEKLNK